MLVGVRPLLLASEGSRCTGVIFNRQRETTTDHPHVDNGMYEIDSCTKTSVGVNVWNITM